MTATVNGSFPVVQGTVVQFTASGGSGSYEYRYWLKGPATGNQYTLLRDYGVAAYTFDTTGYPGTNLIRVEARSQGSGDFPVRTWINPVDVTP